MDGDDAERIAIDEEGEVSLPVVEVLTGRAFLTGKSGAGKSHSASIVAEELLERGFPLLIVDTDGEYWGLKDEYEILHVGADEECDLQVSSEHARKLAELALEDNVPIILDVSGFLDKDEGDALVRETARELFQQEKKLKKPFLMLVEEIHEYIPEGGGLDDTGKMLIRVAKRGRKRGLGLAGMSQRPADVKKDFITQCDWLLWHRLTWENDTKVVRNVVGKEYADIVPDLNDGEAFLMADFLEADVKRVQVRRKRTFDAGATPDLEDFERPDLKNVSGDLVDELEEISEREDRRRDRIARLEDRVDELQDEKAELENELDSARDMRDLAQQMAEGLQSSGGTSDAASEKVDELIEERNDLRSDLEDREARINELEAQVEDLQHELEQRPDIGARAMEAVEVLASEFGVADSDSEALRRKLKNARERIEELESESGRDQKDLEFDPMENRDVRRLVSEVESRLEDFNETRLKMLRYYVVNGAAEVSEAYKYTGNSPSSGWKNDVNRELIKAGFVRETGNGKYDYALEDYVYETLGDHFSDTEIKAVVDELEDRVDDAIMGEIEA
jgi:predicted  nucleic acid-binding Zn-ribbon protein